MNSEKYKWTKRFLFLIPLFLLLCVFIVGGGHGFYQPIFALFPFATFTCIWMTDLTFLNLFLAIIQFPVYGLLIDNANDKKRTWFVILIFHVLIAGLIIVYANPNWNNS